MRIENPQEHIPKGLDEQQALLGNTLNWKDLLEKNKIPPGQRRFREWVEILQKVYPEDPTMPKRKWGKDLYNFVAEKLGIDIDNVESLRFYKTIGTDLDKMGVDCFFTFNNPLTKKDAILTIDITTNPQKDEAKADMVIQASEIPNSHENEENYIQAMERLATHIANQLKFKTEFTH